MILDLINALEEDAKKEFEGFKLIRLADDEETYELANINVYKMDLPVKMRENDENHFPFIIINVLDGSISDINEDEVVTVDYLFGLYNDDSNKQGGLDLLVEIEKMKNHLIHKKYIKSYEIMHPIKWVIQEEDLHPYYYGVLEVKVKIKRIEQERDEWT